MYGMKPRLLLLGGVLVATTACATSEEWGVWMNHPAHFASREHAGFSLRNQAAAPLVATPAVVALAREQGWWGGPFEARPPVDVSGRWAGTWSGVGIFAHQRIAWARAEFIQAGPRGEGRLLLADTLTADVPAIISLEGLRGVRVALEVNGSTLTVRHEANRDRLTGVFTVDGDRMVGRFKDSTARVMLVRQR